MDHCIVSIAIIYIYINLVQIWSLCLYFAELKTGSYCIRQMEQQLIGPSHKAVCNHCARAALCPCSCMSSPPACRSTRPQNNVLRRQHRHHTLTSAEFAWNYYQVNIKMNKDGYVCKMDFKLKLHYQ